MEHRKTFRLFVSSTFEDFEAEREAIRLRVLPELVRMCRDRGSDCELADLRWGIPPEAAGDGTVMDICIEELKQSRIISPRPNFILLLGDRYGWRPIPSHIPLEEFRLLTRFESNLASEIGVIEAAYRIDENAVPEVAELLTPSESGIAEPILRRALRQLIEHRITNAERRVGYFPSATELEIQQGIFAERFAADHVFVAIRRITGLPVSGAPSAWKFGDLDADGKADVDAATRRERLQAQVCEHLGDRIYRYVSSWTGDDNRPITVDHINSLVRDLSAHLTHVITAELAKFDRSPEAEERAVQAAALAEIAAAAVPLPVQIGNILASLSARSVAIVAPSGSGKTTLVAATVSAHASAHPQSRCIGKLLGLTPRSTDPRYVIEDVLDDAVGGLDPAFLAAIRDAKDPAPICLAQLRRAATKQPLMIFLDGLNQLPDAAADRELRWVFEAALENCTFIVSTTPGTIWHSRFEAAGLAVLDVPRWDVAAIAALLDGALARVSRILTSNQRVVALKALSEIDTPLGMRLLLPRILGWRSHDASPPLLGANTAEAVEDLLAEMKRQYGAVLVDTGLRLLLAARFGLSRGEMQEILETDAAVREEVLARSVGRSRELLLGLTAVEHLPPIIWARFAFSLAALFRLAHVDGSLVLQPIHREIERVLRAKLPPKQPHFAMVADHFAARTEGGAFDLRCLSELPYTLFGAARTKALLQLLTDHRFIQAKLRAGRLDDLIADYERSSAPLESPCVHLHAFLQTHRGLLRRGTPAWPSDLILAQLALEQPETARWIRLLSIVETPVFASIAPIHRATRTRWRPISQPGGDVQFAIAINASNALSIVKGVQLHLWDLDLDAEGATWPLTAESRVYIDADAIGIGVVTESSEPRWYASRTGAAIHRSDMNSASVVVSASPDHNGWRIADAFRAQERPYLQPVAEHGSERVFILADGGTLRVRLAPSHSRSWLL